MTTERMKNEEMESRLWKRTLVLEIIGLSIIAWADWRIALGAFFVIWAGNLKHMIESDYVMEKIKLILVRGVK